MNNDKRVLLLGATGFVGHYVAQQLLKNGYELTLAVRDPKSIKTIYPNANTIECDFIKDTTESIWVKRLENIDIIINCVGIFYHRNKDIIWKTHYETPKAIFAAAKQSQVKKIIHLSALGIEQYQNNYAQSKQAAEDFLKNLGIDYIILKPSFIYGQGCRGGLSLIKSLSALPGMICTPGAGEQKFQPIYVEDLALSIINLLAEDKKNLSLAAVSEKTISLKTMMLEIRRWLGFGKAFILKMPMFLLKQISIIGSFFGSSMINKESMQMLELGNTSNLNETEKFQHATGINPRSFTQGLAVYPSSSAERWYARLFLLKPILRLSLAFMWIFSGLTSIFWYQLSISFSLLANVGVPNYLQKFFLYSSSLLNLFIGLALLFNFKTKINCGLQIIVILIYTIIISLKLNYLWFEPFGPIVKNLPIILSILILYSMED